MQCWYFHLILTQYEWTFAHFTWACITWEFAYCLRSSARALCRCFELLVSIHVSGSTSGTTGRRASSLTEIKNQFECCATCIATTFRRQAHNLCRRYYFHRSNCSSCHHHRQSHRHRHLLKLNCLCLQCSFDRYYY